jgi:hypothetical protein
MTSVFRPNAISNHTIREESKESIEGGENIHNEDVF